jgi:hypothetical protein
MARKQTDLCSCCPVGGNKFGIGLLVGDHGGVVARKKIWRYYRKKFIAFFLRLKSHHSFPVDLPRPHLPLF